MQFESNFKCLSFDLFSFRENFVNNEYVSDVYFYQSIVSNVETSHFLITEVKSSSKYFEPNPFSVFHINIRSMKKNEFSESREELQKSNYV